MEARDVAVTPCPRGGELTAHSPYWIQELIAFLNRLAGALTYENVGSFELYAAPDILCSSGVIDKLTANPPSKVDDSGVRNV